MTDKAIRQNKGRLMVHVYLTDKEKKRVEEKAGMIGISVSAYIKVKLFSQDERL